jgi:hypothetical protein
MEAQGAAGGKTAATKEIGRQDDEGDWQTRAADLQTLKQIIR